MKGKVIIDESSPDCESRRCIGALRASSEGGDLPQERAFPNRVVMKATGNLSSRRIAGPSESGETGILRRSFVRVRGDAPSSFPALTQETVYAEHSTS